MKSVGIVAIIFAVCVVIGYFILKEDVRLPIYNPNEVNRELVDAELWNKRTGHTVSDFSLTDQRRRTISQKNFEGKIYVADFFFTRCGTICPKMTEQLARVHKYYEDEEDLMLLSHSVTPDYDTAEVLYAYAEKYEANHDQWLFVYGPSDDIFRLARKSYFAVMEGSTAQETDFVHTENLILIDQKKRIRGYYNGIDPLDVDRLILDIEILLQEE